MSFTTSKEMLQQAMDGGYAVAAFNVENMEMAQAVIDAAAELHAPVMLQTTPSTLKYADVTVLHDMVKAMAELVDTPVAMHLDHGNSLELVNAALAAGYSSVMIDGSQLPLSENVAITSEAVILAHKMDIPVEAELGKVGGKEDELEVKNAAYTDVQEAIQFVRQTGIDALAVAIGTAHGIYSGIPHLQLELLEKLRAAVDLPLVLHGASGVPDDQVRRAVALGINKVNIATELRIPFTQTCRRVLTNDTESFDPKVFLKEAKKAVAEVVRHKIRLCGCAGKA